MIVLIPVFAFFILKDAERFTAAVIGPLTAGTVAIGVSLFAGYGHPWLLAAFVLVWRGIW